jgi:hypothetical protein
MNFNKIASLALFAASLILLPGAVVLHFTHGVSWGNTIGMLVCASLMLAGSTYLLYRDFLGLLKK